MTQILTYQGILSRESPLNDGELHARYSHIHGLMPAAAKRFSQLNSCAVETAKRLWF